MRRTLFVPEGQTILAQQFIAGKGSLCWMSAVGTAEYPPLSFIGQKAFSRPSGTELSDSRNPSNKLLGYCRFVPTGQTGLVQVVIKQSSTHGTKSDKH